MILPVNSSIHSKQNFERKISKDSADKLKSIIAALPPPENNTNTYITLLRNGAKLLDFRTLGGNVLLKTKDTKLRINYLDGEILEIKKPFYRSAKKAINRAGEIISEIFENISNPQQVRKTQNEILIFSKEKLTEKL